MTATKIAGPVRLETTGASYVYEIDARGGYGQVKDVLVMLKVLKVSTPATTTLTVGIQHSPDGSLPTLHSNPVGAVVVATEPVLLVGDTDSPANGPIGEYLHYGITVAGGAGEWAVVELWEVKKPV